MEKIISISKAIKTSQNLRDQGKRIVLVGGCFDILHVGHIIFLENAKQTADVLIALLENDQRIRQMKGENRPIQTQQDRARILAALESVDYVVTLPYFQNDDQYDKLILSIKPAIIATTKGDPFRNHKERQTKLTGGNLVDVLARVKNQSTSRLASVLGNEL
ncbi:MAG: adenylyltransferase/cytidyltransferase family protein [Candidatus Levybacteria bacterium]|nr:adenylyltransferase/cytidyltransferase family protein [Candidatus Levybacteria bacterium]